MRIEELSLDVPLIALPEFHDHLFALVDSAGLPHLRTNESTTPRFEDAGSVKHSRMPYWSIPEAIYGDEKQLTEWAARALEIAQKARTKK